MVLTAAEIAALLIAGLSVTDAIAHAFSNLAAGGFSTKAQSIGGFNSLAVNRICTVFMILAGANFALFYNLVTRHFLPIINDSEFRAYCIIIAGASIALALCITPIFGTIKAAFGPALFHTASVLTSTGFAFADYTQWGSIAQAIIMLLMCIGGCSGSTAGGMKVVRWVIVTKQIGAQFRSLAHPAQSPRHYPVTLNGRSARDDLVYSVGSFFFLYAALAAFTSLVATFSGADLLTAMGTSLSLLGNIGIGLGRVGPAGNYAFYSDLAKLWFCVVMIAGRLELFTLVLVFVKKR
jgi:trk system potassium uptake protein TrkH